MAAPGPEVTALMKRGKRNTASYYKGECFRKGGNNQSLNNLLDSLFDPKTKSIDDVDSIDWCRWLISGGSTFDEFTKTVKQYDNAIICGLVWTANFVAYRCRTCGISPCMSLCAECFQAGQHEGHDFNMFRSKAGGACDCGDVSVMNKDGFCLRHGPDRGKQHSTPPPDLLAIAEAMLPRVVLRLIHHLRDSSNPDMQGTYSLELAMQDAEQYLTFLHSLSDMGAAMRKVMGQALTNPVIYKNMTEVENPEEDTTSYKAESQKKFKATVENMKYPKVFDDYIGMLAGMPGLAQTLNHKTLLEELVFWMVKFEFPQRMVTLLLSLLPDDDYKEAFTRAFIDHYSRISLVLVNGQNRPAIANRVVHISVQLFSNEILAKKMVEEYNLLYTLILSLTHMVENIVTQSTLQDAQMNMHMVVDCDNEVMKDHCYWPVVSDLINLLSHQSIAHKFLGDIRLINMWLELLCYFQGMNLNQRELSQHMGFEPETYYAAFSAELEIASSPMWSLMFHCKNKDTANFTKSMVSVCLENLREWFDAINCMESTKPNPYQLTFHLPLHRYLAIFLVHGVQNQEIPITDFDLAPKKMKTILHHLLQIQVSVSEVYANMWIRNGLQIRGQAMTYVQCHFCYSMVDADLCLQQVCACKLDPDYFVQTVLERYHVTDWLSYSNHPNTDSFKLETEQQLAMVDAALSYLVTLLGVRTYLGIDEKELVRLEMSTLLCVSDRQHSQLTDLMPEKSGMIGHGTELFEPTLKELADYKAPNFEAGAGLQQGTYVPKDFIWEKEFDPVHVALRAVYKKDFQSSMDRYSAFVRQNGKYSGKTPPWPPFKPPGEINPAYKDMFKILQCRTLHAFLFTVLHRALTRNNLPESCLYYCIHLLNLALAVPCTDTRRRSKTFRGCAPNGDYKDWFSSTSLLQNACDTIKEVHVSVLSLEPGDNFTFPADVDLMNSSLEEMFQMAPSTVMSSGGPITAAHSGHIPSHPTIVPMTSEGTFPVMPIHSLSSHSSAKTTDKPKYESKGVSTETAPPVPIPINESLISLLMKLHYKLTGKAGSYVPLSMCKRLPSSSRVGDGSHFITCLLDKMSQQSSNCAKLIEETYQQLTPKSDEEGKQKAGKKEDRKKKAKERQEKLMAQFASKQKAFMEQNFDTDLPDDNSSTTTEKPDTRQVVEEKEFDCVICGHSSPSTADKPIGLVVLVQASSVLGHRLQTEDPIRLPVEGEKGVISPVTCELSQKRQLKALFEHFEETSCQMSVNIGWEGGVVVQTCGHYLHLDCHSSYVASLTTQEVNQNLLVSKGEYWCPLCRQLANSVIPIIPEESRYTLVKPVSPVLTQMVKDIAEMMIRRPITPRSSTLTKSMGSVMEDLTNVTYSVYKTYTTSQSSESVLLFVCSVARSNLEIELLQRGGELTPATSVGRKQSFLPLTHVLSMHSKILTTKPYTDLWSHITGVTCSEGESTSSVRPYNKEVPVLLKDSSALLIQLILTLPATIEKEHFIVLTKMLYNMVFIQALACTSCKFTMDEREAWRKKGRKVSFDSLEGMLSHVITRLEVSRLYEDVDMQDVGIPAICQSVWSPHCVDMAVQDFCLPFLKIAALVRHHIFEQEFPERTPNITEFQEMCQFLGLNKIGTAITAPGQVTSSSIVHWLVAEPLTLVRAWCTDLTNFINTHPSDAKSLLLKNPTWYPPQLIALPRHYYKIFQAYNNATCSMCTNVPKDPALCMVCGHFLCFRQACCQQQRIYECVRHSIECGAGTAMFLLVNSSVVVVIRGPRATLWGCVYLDEHGEEDRDLKRGKPLFLSSERYNLLQHQWISHNFDHSCKRWIWHQDRL